MVDCLTGDLDVHLGLTEGALSTLLLTRGGEGDRGKCLLRLAKGDDESFLMGDFDLDLFLREGRGGEDRLLCLLRE